MYMMPIANQIECCVLYEHTQYGVHTDVERFSPLVLQRALQLHIPSNKCSVLRTIYGVAALSMLMPCFIQLRLVSPHTS